MTQNLYTKRSAREFLINKYGLNISVTRLCQLEKSGILTAQKTVTGIRLFDESVLMAFGESYKKTTHRSKAA